ncbi:D-xylose transporter XylE [Steroidobacter sp. S1-65]|uniref:D-xylose transporter XylE n=1 Tax=Steroidobacter gossypii TaxID=2805490 RepID=A0ABS1X336_9GAMM|nr:D-xylose transporter XylE [Steroidobacter gossypii]MBM0107631.1 D-xylose transporter XylE [Steroidobacter gossypii]
MSQGIPNAGQPSPAEGSLVRGLAFVAALGGLLFGYDTAVISGAVGAIDHNFIAPRGLSETSADSLSGWAISCALLGCVIGAALAGPMSQKIGRRGGLLVSAILFILSSAGSAYPEFGFLWIGGEGPEALTAFILYRILGGVGIGVASMLSPLYIAEIAPPRQRGQLVTYQQVAIVGGMTLVYFVNWFIASQGDDQWVLSTGWRYMLLSAAIPAVLFFALLMLVPETPRWLVMKGRMDEAKAVLSRLSNDNEARIVLKEIDESLRERTGKLFAFGALVVFVGIMLSVFQQFIGINAVLYYAPLMFQNMGASTDSALLQTIIVGVANIVFTLIALVTVDRWGRKPLLILGGVVMAVSMLSLGFLFNSGNVGTAALIAVVAYIAGFALSWGPVVWVLLAEIFPNAIKGKAMALAVAMQWIANLFVSWSFKVLDGNSTLNAMFNHGFSYWVYGVMSILAALFVWRFVPETKGQSLEAIQHLWKPANEPADAAASTKASPANAL